MGCRHVHPRCSKDPLPGSIQHKPDHTAHTGTGPAGTHPPLSPQTTTVGDELEEKRMEGCERKGSKGQTIKKH